MLLFTAAVIVSDAMVGERGLLAVFRARGEYQALDGEIGRIKRQNEKLRDEARRLRDDPTTIEAVARQELGLIRPGEKVFIIHNASTSR